MPFLVQKKPSGLPTWENIGKTIRSDLGSSFGIAVITQQTILGFKWSAFDRTRNLEYSTKAPKFTTGFGCLRIFTDVQDFLMGGNIKNMRFSFMVYIYKIKSVYIFKKIQMACVSVPKRLIFQIPSWCFGGNCLPKSLQKISSEDVFPAKLLKAQISRGRLEVTHGKTTNTQSRDLHHQPGLSEVMLYTPTPI